MNFSLYANKYLVLSSVIRNKAVSACIALVFVGIKKMQLFYLLLLVLDAA